MKHTYMIFPLVLSLSLSGAFASAQDIHSEIDKREVLVLNPMQRQHVLTEMRALLSGVQNILGALAKNDIPAVAGIARPLGLAMRGKAEDHLKGMLPKEFMQLGMAVHQDFDNIAALAESGVDSKEVLRQLSASMNKCQACHLSYQIHTRQSTSAEKQGQHHGHTTHVE